MSGGAVVSVGMLWVALIVVFVAVVIGMYVHSRKLKEGFAQQSPQQKAAAAAEKQRIALAAKAAADKQAKDRAGAGDPNKSTSACTSLADARARYASTKGKTAASGISAAKFITQQAVHVCATCPCTGSNKIAYTEGRLIN
jgi:hypothetical protein